MKSLRKNESVGENGTRNEVSSEPVRENEEPSTKREGWGWPRHATSHPMLAARRGVVRCADAGRCLVAVRGHNVNSLPRDAPTTIGISDNFMIPRCLLEKDRGSYWRLGQVTIL